MKAFATRRYRCGLETHLRKQCPKEAAQNASKAIAPGNQIRGTDRCGNARKGPRGTDRDATSHHLAVSMGTVKDSDQSNVQSWVIECGTAELFLKEKQSLLPMVPRDS